MPVARGAAAGRTRRSGGDPQRVRDTGAGAGACAASRAQAGARPRRTARAQSTGMGERARRRCGPRWRQGARCGRAQPQQPCSGNQQRQQQRAIRAVGRAVAVRCFRRCAGQFTVLMRRSGVGTCRGVRRVGVLRSGVVIDGAVRADMRCRQLDVAQPLCGAQRHQLRLRSVRDLHELRRKAAERRHRGQQQRGDQREASHGGVERGISHRPRILSPPRPPFP